MFKKWKIRGIEERGCEAAFELKTCYVPLSLLSFSLYRFQC